MGNHHNTRCFGIPTASILGLTLGSGCGGSLMGAWGLSAVDGQQSDEIVLYTGGYGDCTYQTAARLEMDFDDRDGQDFEGETELILVRSGSCSETDEDDYDYDTEADRVGQREYAIEVDDFMGDDLELSCTLDRDGLLCIDDDETELLFERL